MFFFFINYTTIRIKIIYFLRQSSSLTLNGRRASDCPKMVDRRSCQPRFLSPPPSVLYGGSCTGRALARAEGRIFASKLISLSIASDRKRRIALQQRTVRARRRVRWHCPTYPLAYFIIILCVLIILMYYNSIVR